MGQMSSVLNYIRRVNSQPPLHSEEVILGRLTKRKTKDRPKNFLAGGDWPLWALFAALSLPHRTVNRS